MTPPADGAAKAGRLSPLFTWRSAVASRGGPKDFAIEVVRAGENADTVVKGATQRHVALTLSLHMNERGGSCYPGIPRIAYESDLGDRTVQRALRALAISGWLDVAIAAAPDGTNRYTATIPDGYSPDPDEGGVPGTPASSRRRTGVPGTPEGVKEDGYVSPSERLRLVVDAWKSNAPPLIEHRDSLYEAAKTRTKIRAALKVYPAEAIAEAIRLHAVCLGDPAYRWTYRWTLPEFLARGLDRFVPEADPLSNFRDRQTRRPTSDDLSDLDDL